MVCTPSNAKRNQLADLAAVPSGCLTFGRLYDVPSRWPPDGTALSHASRADRLAPSASRVDLAALLRALLPGLRLTLELPLTGHVTREGLEVAASEAIAGMRAVLDEVGP
ncbi:hypothetical protein [Jannaschia sp. W003]|uniref:hypothetical protein n=1 Tax=Jannaschia sp. W003 TaxID=2867012 RepID=UPI0021A6EC1A|nr:hypothetical protein [Jannaschia sp. W003]UWQ23127.1 hypothetical protein K3554_16355 [Jannaschia sp. W003]